MATKGVIRDQVPTFQDFYEEKPYRESIWQGDQSSTAPKPIDPSYRGWLEGKPNPVLPEYTARFAKEDMTSPSGTDLADIFPGAPIGTKYPAPDPKLMKRTSYTDRVAAYPATDIGSHNP